MNGDKILFPLDRKARKEDKDSKSNYQMFQRSPDVYNKLNNKLSNHPNVMGPLGSLKMTPLES